LNSLARKAGKPELFGLLSILGLTFVGSYLLGSISVKYTSEFMRVQ
jgi:hypothetical protein